MSSCCFSGYRPSKLSFGDDERDVRCVELKEQLTYEIVKMLADGVTTFYTGMAMGVDIWCAELVLILKPRNKDIRLIAVIPHEGQANYWDEHWRDRYFKALSQVDEKVLIQMNYTKDCMHKRNRYMVEHSQHLIAVWDGQTGGTAYTLNYAKKKGLNIVILKPL